jgi:hypothetical protein
VSEDLNDPHIKTAVEEALQVREYVTCGEPPANWGRVLLVQRSQLEWVRKGLNGLETFPLPERVFVDCEGELRACREVGDRLYEVLMYSTQTDDYFWGRSWIADTRHEFDPVYHIKGLVQDPQWTLSEVSAPSRRSVVEPFLGGAFEMAFCAKAIEHLAKEQNQEAEE